MFDVIIIGGGPAGISASLYTKRGNKKTLVINSESSTLQEVHKIENYYGFENGISGKELYDIGIKQAKNLGIEVKQEEVLSVKINEKGFEVITNKDTYESETVIIAVGNKKNKVKIKGIKDLEGKGVSYCAICDGFFYRDKEVAVIGSGNYAISETNDLINIAKKVSNFLLKFNIDIRRKLFKEIIDELGGNLRFVVSGGAPLDKRVAKGFNELGLNLVQGYGLTETSPVVSAENYKKVKYGSIGIPMDNVEIDFDNKDENGIGELKVKGPNVMLRLL